jgi:SAM-dependent methyltransferase
MIGQTTAALEAGLRRSIQRLIGLPSIHERQKWMAAWQYLATLPASGVRLLDAGCGNGIWALELARLRPEWEITGLDCDAVAIQKAEQARSRLALKNVRFVAGDFAGYQAESSYDAILSVHSAHYMAAAGRGADFFRAVRYWLTPGGQLLLLGPRDTEQAPFLARLPKPEHRWSVFSDGVLRGLCEQEGLSAKRLQPMISRLGAAAKQLAWMAERRGRMLAVVLWPLEWLLTAIDAHRGLGPRDPSVAWLLLAEKEAGAIPRVVER